MAFGSAIGIQQQQQQQQLQFFAEQQQCYAELRQTVSFLRHAACEMQAVTQGRPQQQLGGPTNLLHAFAQVQQPPQPVWAAAAAGAAAAQPQHASAAVAAAADAMTHHAEAAAAASRVLAAQLTTPAAPQPEEALLVRPLPLLSTFGTFDKVRACNANYLGQRVNLQQQCPYPKTLNPKP